MKKDENKISVALEQLVNQKPFEGLTVDERKLVLQEINEEEYKLLHATALQVKHVLKKHRLSPDMAVEKSILDAFDGKYSKQSSKKIFPLFNYSVPLYQAAAAVVFTVLTLFAFHFFNLKEDISNPRVIYVEKRDTVFIPLGSAITSQIDSNRNKHGISPKSVLPVHETITKYATSKIGLREDERKKVELTRCHSIKQDSSLKQFMVSIE